jgi:YesN/AraC family two-component response regulator
MEKKRILIIDDEGAILRMVRLALEKAGYEVLDASNGIEGLDIYHEALPDLVITDIFMPEMEGLEMIMALRRENKNIKIIAISGGGTNGFDHLPTAIKLGALRAVAKPFTQKELLGAVCDLLKTDANVWTEGEVS